MSSEAAVYFPDALPNPVKVCESVPGEVATSAQTLAHDPSLISYPERSFASQTEPSVASDESLLEQIGEGSREALSLLFRRHARAVRNVAFRILRNEAEADDLVQEVFLYLFRKASLFNGARGTAGSWIFHATYHRAFDRRRYLNSRHFYANDELKGSALHLADPREDVPFHGKSIEGILGKQVADKIKERLTAEQQETIHLYFFEGYSLKEIAERTGRSLVNVRSHYYRGLDRLRMIVHPEKLRSK
jgi:RNA polymerase sigma-70 factor (ECF subfamily)